MKNTYTKDKGCFNLYNSISDEYADFVEEEKDSTLFHIGQSYSQTPIKKLSCKICGSDSFNVGVGDHFTGIRCVKCEWEVCIHDG